MLPVPGTGTPMFAGPTPTFLPPSSIFLDSPLSFLHLCSDKSLMSMSCEPDMGTDSWRNNGTWNQQSSYPQESGQKPYLKHSQSKCQLPFVSWRPSALSDHEGLILRTVCILTHTQHRAHNFREFSVTLKPTRGMKYRTSPLLTELHEKQPNHTHKFDSRSRVATFMQTECSRALG